MQLSRTMVWTAAVVGLASVSFAQGPGGRGFGGRGGRGVVSLSAVEAVQKEIAVSDEAKEKITKLAASYTEELRADASGAGGNFRDLSEEDRRKAMEKMAEARAKVDAKFIPQLKEILSADQFKRVQEIHRQSQGAEALTNAEFAKELGISEEQQKKIAEITREYGQKTRALFSGGGDGGGQANFAKMQELNKERDEKVVEVLDAGQKEKFAAAKGKPFDLAQLRQGGPGGRGQRPQN